MIDKDAVLVVDLGGVTCRWDPDRRLAALAELSGLPADTVDQLVFASGFDDAAERGQFSLFTFTSELATMLGLALGDDTSVALRLAWASAFAPDPAMVRLVDQAATRTALFTNNGPLLEAALDHELAEVGAAFDERLFSWRLGAAKPDAAAFEAASAQLEVGPEDIFFVDDSAANIEAATAAGWRTHHYTDTLNLRLALARTGIN